jgi:hypothetical protein
VSPFSSANGISPTLQAMSYPTMTKRMIPSFEKSQESWVSFLNPAYVLAPTTQITCRSNASCVVLKMFIKLLFLDNQDTIFVNVLGSETILFSSFP